MFNSSVCTTSTGAPMLRAPRPCFSQRRPRQARLSAITQPRVVSQQLRRFREQ
jgi:hypothetical protein